MLDLIWLYNNPFLYFLQINHYLAVTVEQIEPYLPSEIVVQNVSSTRLQIKTNNMNNKG